MTQTMRRVMFVDDEPSLLQGIRRMLRPLRSEWEMEFFESGQEALSALEKKPCDVIVSDMRMPGMDGLELMSQVQSHHPDVVRILLSGAADKDSVLKSVEPSHQYLSKPCDPDRLKSTISRACALRDLLNSDALKNLVTQVVSLPSLPSVYGEVTAALRSPDSSIQEVGDLIAKDVAMTAKLLKLVNSSYFGLPRAVDSPAQAASVIGIQMVKSLVLSVGVFAQFKNVHGSGFSIGQFERHSFQVAGLAKAIAGAEQDDKQVVANSFLAGIVHDVGKLVLVQNLAEQYQTAFEQAKANGIELAAAEREVFGASHAEIGAYLLGLWGLPDDIVEAIAFHHAPEKVTGGGFRPLTAVHVANVLVHEQHVDDGMTWTKPNTTYLESIGLADRLETWRQLANGQVGED